MSFWDTLKGVGSAAESMAPYVAPVIERNRQRNLQQLMMQQQEADRAEKDKLAQAIGQSTIGRNNASAAASNARAGAITNPPPKPPPIKTIAAQDGTLYKIYADGSYEAAQPHTTEPGAGPPTKLPGVAAPIPSAPSGIAGPGATSLAPASPSRAPTPQGPPPPQSAAPPVATAPKFGPRAPVPKTPTPGPLTTVANSAGKAYRARVSPDGTTSPLMTTKGDTAFVAPPPVNEGAQAYRDAGLALRQDAMGQRNEARIVQQHAAAIKPHTMTAAAAQAINENRTGALSGDPIAQQTLLQDFIKLNLPGQMVTAGELHNYAGLMGLGDKGQQLLQKLQTGTPLSRKQVELILGHADNLLKARRQAFDITNKTFVDRATREKVDPSVLVNPYEVLDLPTGKDVPRGTSAPSGGDTAVNPFAALIPKKKP